ncbi:DUF1211 domain-containing protein [Candidatus Acetothermia bacterium]|nr:DUF1211 domain-containing protein [Candidatus Acetothermia bacterium]
MSKTRLEAFSDGVVAIIITIMVLELKVPQGTDWDAIRPALSLFLTYALSFIFLGIYWNNHHHMFHMADHVNGKILWANLHLLFWLSLIPFTTRWVGEENFAALPTAIYGVVLLLAACAYIILQASIVGHQGKNSKLKAAVGSDLKGKLSVGCYIAAIPLAFVSVWLSMGIYLFVALLWLVPDRRIEKKLRS